MLFQIMRSVIQFLVQNEQLELSQNADIDQLATELVQKMPSASFGSHFGSWLAKALIEHESVEELFASDKDLKNVLQDIDFYRKGNG